LYICILYVYLYCVYESLLSCIYITEVVHIEKLYYPTSCQMSYELSIIVIHRLNYLNPDCLVNYSTTNRCLFTVLIDLKIKDIYLTADLYIFHLLNIQYIPVASFQACLFVFFRFSENILVFIKMLIQLNCFYA
jgi:hypothetical protein